MGYGVIDNLNEYGATGWINEILGKGTTMRQEQAYNAKQAQINRDYQTEMANTAIQRQMEDAQKAGVNPLNMNGSGGGAGIPSSATAESHSAGGDASSGVLSVIASLIIGLKKANAEQGAKTPNKTDDIKTDSKPDIHPETEKPDFILRMNNAKQEQELFKMMKNVLYKEDPKILKGIENMKVKTLKNYSYKGDGKIYLKM